MNDTGDGYGAFCGLILGDGSNRMHLGINKKLSLRFHTVTSISSLSCKGALNFVIVDFLFRADSKPANCFLKQTFLTLTVVEYAASIQALRGQSTETSHYYVIGSFRSDVSTSSSRESVPTKLMFISIPTTLKFSF